MTTPARARIVFIRRLHGPVAASGDHELTRKTSNIQHPTSNIECPISNGLPDGHPLDVGCFSGSYRGLGLVADDVEEYLFQIGVVLLDQFGHTPFNLELALVDD